MHVVSLLRIVVVGVALFAFIDAVVRPSAAWVYAGVKRGMWLGIAGAAVVVTALFGPIGLLPIAGIVASIVYLVEYRPKLRSYPGRRSTPSPWS